MWIPFFPRSLTAYMASSAAWMSCSADAATSGSVATPTDTVSEMVRPSARRNDQAAIFSRMRSPTKSAPSLPVSGRTRANSSPPKRATMSVSRALAADHGRGFDQRPAPIEMAVIVVDRLEAIEVDEQQRQRPAVSRCALRLASQDLREIPRVVQLRQVVGDRQLFGALHPHGVVDRDGGRFERAPSRRTASIDRIVDRATSGTRSIADERADRAAAARERQADRRDGDAGLGTHHPPVGADIRGTERIARSHHPHAHGGGGAVERGRQRPGGESARVAPAIVARQHQPSRRGHPFASRALSAPRPHALGPGSR